MKHGIEDLFRILRRDPLHPLHLTAYCQDDPAQLGESLAPAISGCGGWLLGCSPAPGNNIRATFEIERGASLELYAVLARLGLRLDEGSERAMTQTCQCTHYIPEMARLDIITVELLIEQLHGDAFLGMAA